MKLLILSTTTDDAENVRYVLADQSLKDPEILIRGLINEVAAHNPRYQWGDISAALASRGFVVPEVAMIHRPWDELHDPCFGVNFTVQFPDDAQHEYAGRQGTATTSAGGVLGIVLSDNTILTPWDQPYKTGSEGIDQIPLGPVTIPPAQFSEADHLHAAAALLREAGFECLA